MALGAAEGSADVCAEHESRRDQPVMVTTVVSLVLYTLAQAPERVVSASLGVNAP